MPFLDNNNKVRPFFNEARSRRIVVATASIGVSAVTGPSRWKIRGRDRQDPGWKLLARSDLGFYEPVKVIGFLGKSIVVFEAIFIREVVKILDFGGSGCGCQKMTRLGESRKKLKIPRCRDPGTRRQPANNCIISKKEQKNQRAIWARAFLELAEKRSSEPQASN